MAELCYHATLAPTRELDDTTYQSWATCRSGPEYWCQCTFEGNAGPVPLEEPQDETDTDPVPSTAIKMMDVIAEDVCDVVLEAAIRLLLHVVYHEVHSGELLHAHVALFFARILAKHENDLVFDDDADKYDPTVVKAEWHPWLKFPPLLDLLDTALSLPDLDKSGLTMLSGYHHAVNFVTQFKAEQLELGS